MSLFLRLVPFYFLSVRYFSSAESAIKEEENVLVSFLTRRCVSSSCRRRMTRVFSFPVRFKRLLSLSLLFLRLDDESIFRADNCILTYLARPSPILIGNTPMCVRTSIVRSVLFICLIFFLLLSFSSAFVQVRSEELHFEEYD